jgi:hypothetical protein
MRHMRGCDEIEGGPDAEPRDRLAGRFGALDGAADDARFEASALTWPLPDNVTGTVLETRLYASQSPFEFRTLSLLLGLRRMSESHQSVCARSDILAIGPLPVLYLRHVLAVLTDVARMLDQCVTKLLFNVS